MDGRKSLLWQDDHSQKNIAIEVFGQSISIQKVEELIFPARAGGQWHQVYFFWLARWRCFLSVWQMYTMTSNKVINPIQQDITPCESP